MGEITYLKVGSVYRYLVVVMDQYSRRVIGWAYGGRTDVALTLKALKRAVCEIETVMIDAACSQTSIDCWAKIPAIAPCHDAVVTEGIPGVARSPAA